MSRLRRVFDTLGAWFVRAAPVDGADGVLAVVPARYQDAAREHLPAIREAAREVHHPDQLAYILATVEHECGFGTPRYSRSVPLVEDHNPFRQTATGWEATVHTNRRRVRAASLEALEIRYWDSAYGGRLGNRPHTGDGAAFRGRGYVQLTGRDNYARLTRHVASTQVRYEVDGRAWGPGGEAIDLLAHPTHVNRVPRLAAGILVDGMMRGLFTGRALPEFVGASGSDFREARRVVNGTDRAAAIASIAERYARVLRG